MLGGLPFINMELVDQEPLEQFTERIFATDRDLIPKGMIEVMQCALRTGASGRTLAHLPGVAMWRFVQRPCFRPPRNRHQPALARLPGVSTRAVHSADRLRL